MTALPIPENLAPIIDQAIAQTGISGLEEIYRGTYYAPGNIRNIIFRCNYQGQKAVLKAYNDPHDTLEASALADFHLHNKSHIIRAPKLFASTTLDTHRGWLLMEEIPASAKRYDYLMPAADRQEFLQVYLEYRRNFPTTPTRELMLVENLPATDFHTFRMGRWLELANQTDYNYFLQTGQHIADPQKLTQLVGNSITKIRETFTGRPMIWSHGHFKHHEIFKIAPDDFMLIDFAHNKMFPEGYELAFIIWADYLMAPNNWQQSDQQWLAGIKNWLNSITPIAEKTGLADPEKLLPVALLERTIGTILADVIGAEKPIEEKHQRLAKLFLLAEKLLSETL